jgi:ribosomal-protein-alanine N-acetyltransferase
MKAINTERLLLREFVKNDAEFIRELLNTEGWLKYIGQRNVSNQPQAIAFIEGRLRPSYIEHGFGFFCVELKERGTPIGMCGLVKREGLENVDLGFAFLPAYFGKGYGIEACESVIHFAKTDMNLKALDAITMSINKSSIGLLERLGFHFERNIILNDEELMLYRKVL